MDRVRAYLTTALMLTPLVGCAQCAPGKVGTGLARLSVRNFGVLVSLVGKDSACGFEAAHVKDAVLLSGEPGSEGTATYSVSACTIDIPESDPVFSEDCNGRIYTIYGKVTVTAKKQVGGLITGSTETPIIPGGPDAATVYVEEAKFENFYVAYSASPNKLTMIDATMSGKLQPRLAASASAGVCSISTKDAMFTDLIYQPNSLVHITTETRDFDVPVGGSVIWAVNGQHSELENAIGGTVVVWGGEQDVPNDGDGLDPDYDSETFKQSWACEADLALPVSYECGGALGPRLAQNASRLTVRTLGRVATALEADTVCGFSSPTVQAAAQIDGAIGGLGTATLTTPECAIDFGEGQVTQTTCAGVETVASGRVVVRGIKRLTGRLTGDAVTPVVPVSESPAEIQLEIVAFDDLQFEENGSAMKLVTGGLSGTLRPMVVADAEQSGLCAFTTPIARFTDLKYTAPTAVIIKSASGAFGATIEDSNIFAVNGTWASDSNVLDGTIVLDGEPYMLPTDPADDGLDPAFDQATFDAGWQCGSVQLPISTACDPTPPLAQGAAQLSIQTIGKLAQLLEADTTCGFSSSAVLSSGVITGDLGYDGGSVVYDVSTPCVFDFPEKTEIATDCNGKRVYAKGRVSLTGTKTILGIVSGDPLQPIVPTDWEPATIDVRATFDKFAMWADPEVNILEVASGSLSGTMNPRVAQDTTTGACSISTPVARFTDVAYEMAKVTIVKGGLRFNIDVPGSVLTAQNGVGAAQTNYLSGTIRVDGNTYNVPIAGQPILDPEYDQASFDASYACVPNMVVAANTEQCNMKRPLAEGVARLLALVGGTLASEINNDDGCGFEDFWVKTSPDRVVGDSGEQGLLEWSIADCGHSNNASNPVYVDCRGRQRFLDANVTVDATRTITGERETILVLIDSIIPNEHDSVSIALTDVEINHLEVFEREGDLEAPFRGLSIDGGRLAATVGPILAENAEEPGRYDVPTPVVHVTNLDLRGAPVTVSSAGKTFKFTVDTTSLEMFNGSWVGASMTNYLNGSVTIDGEQIALNQLPLDPAYSQSEFDSRYACQSALMSIITPE